MYIVLCVTVALSVLTEKMKVKSSNSSRDNMITQSVIVELAHLSTADKLEGRALGYRARLYLYTDTIRNTRSYLTCSKLF